MKNWKSKLPDTITFKNKSGTTKTLTKKSSQPYGRVNPTRVAVAKKMKA